MNTTTDHTAEIFYHYSVKFETASYLEGSVPLKLILTKHPHRESLRYANYRPPLGFQMMIPSWASVCGYAAAVLAIFVSIKVTNYRLHTTFDEGEVVKREVRQRIDPGVPRTIGEDTSPASVLQELGLVAVEETAGSNGDNLQSRADEYVDETRLGREMG